MTDKRFKKLEGRRFRRLIVLCEDIKRRVPGKHRAWWCRCACGRTVSVWQDHLVSKDPYYRTNTCGCGNKSIAKSRGIGFVDYGC